MTESQSESVPFYFTNEVTFTFITLSVVIYLLFKFMTIYKTYHLKLYSLFLPHANESLAIQRVEGVKVSKRKTKNYIATRNFSHTTKKQVPTLSISQQQQVLCTEFLNIVREIRNLRVESRDNIENLVNAIRNAEDSISTLRRVYTFPNFPPELRERIEYLINTPLPNTHRFIYKIDNWDINIDFSPYIKLHDTIDDILEFVLHNDPAYIVVDGIWNLRYEYITTFSNIMGYIEEYKENFDNIWQLNHRGREINTVVKRLTDFEQLPFSNCEDLAEMDGTEDLNSELAKELPYYGEEYLDDSITENAELAKELPYYGEECIDDSITENAELAKELPYYGEESLDGNVTSDITENLSLLQELPFDLSTASEIVTSLL